MPAHVLNSPGLQRDCVVSENRDRCSVSYITVFEQLCRTDTLLPAQCSSAWGEHIQFHPLWGENYVFVFLSYKWYKYI